MGREPPGENTGIGGGGPMFLLACQRIKGCEMGDKKGQLSSNMSDEDY